jgi:hypothetical protein
MAGLEAFAAAARTGPWRVLLSPWRLLRAVWLAVPGDIMGWSAMRICRIPTATRMVEVDGVRVNVIEDPRAGRLLDHQGMALAAQTLGRYVFSKGPLDQHTLDHELEHVRQWRRYGPLYEPVYFIQWGLAKLRGGSYGDNRFERAAERRADMERAAREAAAAAASAGGADPDHP